MISTTLYDAADDIRQHQRDYPERYNELKPQIDLLLQHMDLVRQMLAGPSLSDAQATTLADMTKKVGG